MIINIDLLVNIKNFQSSNYEEILELVKKEDYSSYWSFLSDIARKEIELENDKKEKFYSY